MVALFALIIHVSNCVRPTTKLNADIKIASSQTDTCDNPDANINCCFTNMPQSLTSTMIIAQKDEPGDRLIITGTFFHADGVTPYPNVIFYAYHTDNTGHYSKKGKETGFQKWHGHLHGWCKSDSNGHYQIQTIRPARYPDNSMPAHIHAAFKTPKGQVEYITDYVFKDDSLVTKKYLSSLFSNIGGTGIVEVEKTSPNIWTGKRDLILKD